MSQSNATARYVSLIILRDVHRAKPWRRTGGSGSKWKGAQCTCGWSLQSNGISKREAERLARLHVEEVYTTVNVLAVLHEQSDDGKLRDAISKVRGHLLGDDRG